MALPTDAEIAAALAATHYVYTDPVGDEGADITALDPADPPDRFPPEAECRA